MYKVKKLFRVPIGHQLSKHKGLCKNCHGHNLKFEVQVSSENLNDNGMVIDFKDLKKIVKKIILDPLDHCMIVNSDNTKLRDFLKENGYKYIVFSCDPTAEVLSKHFYIVLQKTFKNSKKYKSLKVDFVRIWENDDSMAEYSE